MPHFLLLIALDGAGHGGLVASFIEMLGFFVGKVPSRHSEYQKKKSFVKVKNWHINIIDSFRKPEKMSSIIFSKSKSKLCLTWLKTAFKFQNLNNITSYLF